MILNRVITILFLAFYCVTSFSQSSKIHFDKLTYRDGLNQNTVYTINQDKDGFIWIGTQSGLSVYDGLRFRNIDGLDAKFIHSISISNDGNLWIGSQNGLCVYNKSTKKSEVIPYYVGYQINSIQIADSLLYISSNKGFLIYDFLKKETVFKNDKIGNVNKSILFKEFIWLATSQGLYKIQKKSYENIKKVEDGIFTSLYNDAENVIAGTENGGIFSKGSYKSEIELKDAHIYDINQDIENNFWVGTNKGLIILNKNLKVIDSLYEYPSDKSGLSENTIYNIFRDKSNQIWLGTKGGGINKYDYKKAFFYTYYDSPIDSSSIENDFVWSFTNYDNKILVGTNYKGIQIFDPITEKFYQNPNWNQFSKLSIQSLYKAYDNSLWVGTEKNGFYYKKPESSRFSRPFEKGARVKTFKAIGDYIYVGGDKLGFIKFNMKTRKNASEKIQDKFVYTIVPDSEDKNILWIGTISQGLFKYEIASDSISSIKFKDSVFLKNELSIISIYQDEIHPEILFLGTNENGLISINKHTFEIKDNIRYDDGLPSNTIYGIVKGKQSDLWLSTSRGLCRVLTKKDSTLQFQKFDEAFGLTELEFNGGAYYSDKNSNDLYFGSISGMIRVDGAQNFDLQNSLPIQLLSYQIDNNKEVLHEDFDIEYFNNDSIPKITMSTDDSVLQIRFGSLDYSTITENNYKIKLKNGDNNTIDMQGNVFSLKNLNVGSNIFCIEKNNPYTIENNINLGFFIVDVYIPITFYILWFAVILSIVFGLYFFIKQLKRSKINKSLKEQIEKQNLADIEDSNDLLALNIEVSKCIDEQDLSQLSIAHLIDNRFFKFDYGIFCKVDYLSQKIIPIYFEKNHNKIKPLEEWIPSQGISINDKNVVAITVRKKELIEVRKNLVNNISIDIRGDQQILDTSRYKDYKQDELHRWFIPVIERIPNEENIVGDIVKKSDNEKDVHINSDQRVLGVIEAGFHLSSHKSLTNSQKSKLMLYTSSIAETYYRIYRNKINDEINLNLELKSNESKDNHNLYLRSVLDWVCQYIHIFKAYIVIIGGESEKYIDSNDDSCSHFYFNISQYEIDTFDIISEGRTLDRENKNTICSISNILNGKEKYNNSYPEKISETLLQIRHKNKVIGFAKFIGEGHNFFNEDNLMVLDKIFEDIGQNYITKKYHNAVAKLVLPFNILKDLHHNLEPVIESIEKYFSTNLISVWLRNYDSEEFNYRQTIQSGSITHSELFHDYLQSNAKINKSINKYQPIDLNEYLKIVEHDRIVDYKNKNIKKVIHVPLSIDDRNYGFINIYFRNEFVNVFYEDQQYLRYIAEKTVISKVTTRMISNFSFISETLVSNSLNNSLNKIVINAYEILHCKPVILYQCRKDGRVLHDKIVSYGILDEKKVKTNSKNTFIEIFLAENKKVGWYESKKSLPRKYLNQIKKGEDNFWNRERIESLVVVRLKHENSLIGVMCFNYREQQVFGKFPERTVNGKLILAFADLAQVAIINAKNIDIIQEQTKKIEKYAEQITFDYEETYNKMQNMLPSANAASYKEILRAVNHDIRNHLLKVNYKIEDLVKKYSNVDYELIEIQKEIQNDITNSGLLINLFKPESFEVYPEDIDQIISEVADLFIDHSNKKFKNKGIQIDISDLNCDRSIRCSRALLSMIIYNLMSNSRKAIIELWNAEGRKTNSPNGTIKVTSFFDKDNGKYVIIVKDDGIGIDNELIEEQIYEAGYSTAKDGMGIGLYFVRETIRQIFNGKVYARSPNQKGAIFTLRFKQQIT